MMVTVFERPGTGLLIYFLDAGCVTGSIGPDGVSVGGLLEGEG